MSKEQNKFGHLIDEATKTPRTQAAIKTYGDYIRSEDAVSIEFAEQLETELAEARAEVERLKAAGSTEAMLAVTERYYSAKCSHCGWIGSSEFCIENRCYDDSEVLCPLCLRHISDDEPAEKDIADFLNRTVIKAFWRKDKLIEQMREVLRGVCEKCPCDTRLEDARCTHCDVGAVLEAAGREIK